MVKSEAAIGADKLELEDITIEIAQATVVADEGNRHHLSDHSFKRNGRVIRQHLDRVSEIAR
jgi:hypothetical protein